MNILIKLYQDNPLLLFLLICIAILYSYYLYGKEKLTNPQARDKPRTPSLKIGTPNHANGIIFGRKGRHVYYSPAETEGHVFCCASSGAGKTSALAIPSICAFGKDTKNGTCFCIDISGDLSKQCDIPNKCKRSIASTLPAKSRFRGFA